MSNLKRRSLHNINVPYPIAASAVSDWNADCSFVQESFLQGEVHHADLKMDQFLDSQGLFRYHLPIDGSCLFRAVSEVLSGCQTKHQTIRQNCCDYILGNKKELAKDLDRNQNVEEYVQRLRDLQYPGGNSEMHILSKIYKVDFLVYYRPETVPVNVTHGGHEKKVLLCWSHNKQFDLVYTKQHIEALRVTQAIVYDVLYKDVFELGSNEVDFAVNQMLYEKENFKNKRHLTFTQWCNSVVEGQEADVPKLPKNKGEQIVLAVRCGVPPFPFKVAKCLDPKILRNVEYLNWCEEKRDAFRSGSLVTPTLDTGVKCTARIGMKEHTGFIQSIDRKAGLAQVFLQSIGEIRPIPVNDIVSSPVKRPDQSGGDADEFSKSKPLTSTPLKNRRSLSTGDALLNDQKGLVERFNHLTILKEKTLTGIPETNDQKYNSYDEVFTDGRKYGRKHSLPASHSTPITTAPATTFYRTNTSVAMIPAPMSPLIVDATCHYHHMGVSPTADGALYTPPPPPPPQSHYLRPAAETYPLVGTVPVVPLTQFNPSVPPPTFQNLQSEMEPTEEMVDFGFSFSGPPAGMDVSAVSRSERLDGSDLPAVDVLRYFFNLGVSVYRMRKADSTVIADDTLLQASPSNASYAIPSQIAGYSLVPQHGVVYQPNFQQFYSVVPNQQQGSFAEVPTFQVGPVLANK